MNALIRLYDPNVLEKLRRASQVGPQAYQEGLAAVLGWRDGVARRREFDVFVGPTSGIPVPDAAVDELAIRDRFGRNTRWVNLLDCAAVAIGPVQVAGVSEGAVLAVARRIEEALPTARPGTPADSAPAVPAN